MDNQQEKSRWESPDKSFIKIIKQEGKGLSKPNDGTKCLVNIIPLVANSVTDEVIGYKLNEDVAMCIGNGDAELSEVFEACVESMTENETSELLIPLDIIKNKWPDFKNESITETSNYDGSNAVFQVQLKKFSPRKQIWELEPHEKIKRATELKEIGSDNFKRGKFSVAEKFYTKCLKVLITMGVEKTITEYDEDQISAYNSVRCAALLNLAACQLKCNRFEFVIEHCTKALAVDPKNVKGLYRRGQAYTAINEFEKAKEDLNHALELEPKNKAVITQMKALNSKIKLHCEQYKKGMSKMFGGPVT
ncbi:peptidyl-prolyl cis-trans isomerase FKBP4-like [Antedon mediterranea]|uniref:peptidyl-prolyl cis-trans isomerase FKBP4-like n=1 Tax=Antedon mediterranea TaxID=105859 RepID=UPI003AF8003B